MVPLQRRHGDAADEHNCCPDDIAPARSTRSCGARTGAETAWKGSHAPRRGAGRKGVFGRELYRRRHNARTCNLSGRSAHEPVFAKSSSLPRAHRLPTRLRQDSCNALNLLWERFRWKWGIEHTIIIPPFVTLSRSLSFTNIDSFVTTDKQVNVINGAVINT